MGLRRAAPCSTLAPHSRQTTLTRSRHERCRRVRREAEGRRAGDSDRACVACSVRPVFSVLHVPVHAVVHMPSTCIQTTNAKRERDNRVDYNSSTPDESHWCSHRLRTSTPVCIRCVVGGGDVLGQFDFDLAVLTVLAEERARPRRRHQLAAAGAVTRAPAALSLVRTCGALACATVFRPSSHRLHRMPPPRRPHCWMPPPPRPPLPSWACPL
jgi:hypothetical protein